MKSAAPTAAAALAAGLLAPVLAWGADPAPSSTVPSTSDDRIALSADGATLTGTDGGYGGSVGWLHNFDADTLAGVAAEHQQLYNTNWTFGSLNGSLTRGAAGARYSAYGEVHEGAGESGTAPLRYEIEAVGVIGTYFSRFSAQFEDRRIDVLKSHGNLPKLGLTYLWSPRIATQVTYIQTVSGNLGTQLTSVRIDDNGPTLNYFAGGAFGHASPAALNLQGLIVAPGSVLREGYVGLSKPVPALRGELSVVADYIDLSKSGFSSSKHITLTVNYIFHVGHR